MFKAIKEFFGFYEKKETPVVEAKPEVKAEVKATAKPVPAKQATATPKKPATKTRSAAVAKGTKGRKKK